MGMGGGKGGGGGSTPNTTGQVGAADTTRMLNQLFSQFLNPQTQGQGDLFSALQQPMQAGSSGGGTLDRLKSRMLFMQALGDM